MKVVNVMQTEVNFVLENTPLLVVSKLIFGVGINGLPVCRGRKIVGFITERDILDKFLPTIQEYMEDPVNTGDFERMETKINEILSLPASQIMSHKPVTITAETPLLRAYSTMIVSKVGRLPVVDKKNNLIGILSKSDIFKALVGQKLPFEKDEQFHDWLSRRWNRIIDWDKRLKVEIPDLASLFKKNGVKSVLDLGCGTGMHDIALAKEGFRVVGIDTSRRMIDAAKDRLEQESQATRRNAAFINTGYESLMSRVSEKFDALICMGSGLAHLEDPWRALKEVNKILNEKSLMVIQVTNFSKITKRRLMDFITREVHVGNEKEQAFIRFCDQAEKGYVNYNVAVFGRGPNKWNYKGMSSTLMHYLNKEKILAMLKKIGFTKTITFGGEKGFFYDHLFGKPYNQTESDVLVIVGTRGKESHA